VLINCILISGPLKTMASGAIGGIFFWTSVFPADVVKSRIQVTGSKEPFFRLLMNIFRQEGLLTTHYVLERKFKFILPIRNIGPLQWIAAYCD